MAMLNHRVFLNQYDTLTLPLTLILHAEFTTIFASWECLSWC